MLSRKSDEHRQSPRYPLERLAKIQPGNGSPQRYCKVIDVSDGGVRLQAFGFEVPDEFVLMLAGDGPAQDGRYSVIWRFGYDVGAKYVGPAARE